MFVSLTPNEDKVKDWWERWAKCKAEYSDPSWDRMKPMTENALVLDDGREFPGFYCGSEHELNLFKEFPKEPDYYDSYMFFSTDIDFKTQYGVADTPEQIIEEFKREYNDQTRQFVVVCRGILIEEADENEKFYKQGPYIGKAKSGRDGEYNPFKKTEEIKKNGYLIQYHIYPLPGTEPYPSWKYNVIKKYVIPEKPAIKNGCKIEIISHGEGDNWWRRNGDVDVRFSKDGKVIKENHMTMFCAVQVITNLIYYSFSEI